MAALRMEDHPIAPGERLAPDGARAIVQTLAPTTHARTPHDRRVLVEGGAEQRRARQAEGALAHPRVQPWADLPPPGVHVDFGAPQAQRRCAAQCHQGLPLAAVQAAVCEGPYFFRVDPPRLFVPRLSE